MNTDLNIAFLTGQSDRGRCALSPAQSQFLQRLAGPGRRLLESNFPYTTTLPHRETSLLTASWNNFWLYARSHSSHFARIHRPAVIAMLERAEHTLFLAGSCGLELFNHLYLPREYEERSTLLCYGPVASQPPRFARAVMVQGRSDLITRLAYTQPARQIEATHLDYLRRPEFLSICRQTISQIPLPCSNISA